MQRDQCRNKTGLKTRVENLYQCLMFPFLPICTLCETAVRYNAQHACLPQIVYLNLNENLSRQNCEEVCLYIASSEEDIANKSRVSMNVNTCQVINYIYILHLICGN